MVDPLRNWFVYNEEEGEWWLSVSCYPDSHLVYWLSVHMQAHHNLSCTELEKNVGVGYNGKHLSGLM